MPPHMIIINLLGSTLKICDKFQLINIGNVAWPRMVTKQVTIDTRATPPIRMCLYIYLEIDWRCVLCTRANTTF